MTMMSSHLRIQPRECSQSQLSLPRAVITAPPRRFIARVSRLRSRALTLALARAVDLTPWPLGAVPAPRPCFRWAGFRASHASATAAGGPPGGERPTPRRPCQQTARHGSRAPIPEVAGLGERPDTTLTHAFPGGSPTGSQSTFEAGSRLRAWPRAEPTRRCGCDPWLGGQRESPGLHACACAAGNRASSPDGGCWAGRCASWSGSWANGWGSPITR